MVESLKKSSFVIVFAMLVGALIFTGQVFAESSKNSSNDVDQNKNDLIVLVEANSENQAALESADNVIISSATLEQKGFQISDSMLEVIQEDATAMSDDFKMNVIEHMGLVYLVEYSETDYKNSEQAKKELEKTLESMDMNVRYVQENYSMHALEQPAQTLEPMDVHPNQEWNYNMIHAPEAWDTTPGSNDTKIAVLDTGIDSNHRNLSDYVDTEAGESFVGGDTGDVQGHGTHVAGTIVTGRCQELCRKQC